MKVQVRFFGDNRNRLGESPVWDEANQCLWWIDASAVAATESWIRSAAGDGTPLANWHVARSVGSIALAEGGLVAAMADGFYRVDGAGKAEQLVQCDTLGGGIRFNDGKVDRAGNFLSGQLEVIEQPAPASKLWRLGSASTAVILEKDLRLANAICFSPAGDIIYFADSPERLIRIHRYDPARATLGERIGAIDCAPLGSIPDGATVDRDGNLWVALVLAQCVVCLSPKGELLRRVEVPVPFPSCPAFGGPGLETLFVTTIANSGRNLATDHPDAGRIVAIEGHGTGGIAEARWSSKN
jgi:sugar lactone lactonase YvrE